jgi:hypothetical protein
VKARVGLLALVIALAGCASVPQKAADSKAASADPAPRYCVYANGDGSAVMKYEGTADNATADDKSKPCAIPVYPNELAMAFGFFVFH